MELKQIIKRVGDAAFKLAVTGCSCGYGGECGCGNCGNCGDSLSPTSSGEIHQEEGGAENNK